MMKRKIGRRALWVAAALGLLGLVLAVESYRQFHSALAGEGTWCSFGEISSCEKAFQSEYSTLFGRPIALYGGVAYFLVAAIALVGLLNGGPYVLASLFHLALLSIPLLIATLYFGWALFFQVKTLCVLCVTDYLINLAAMVVVWRACWKLRPPYLSLLRWDIRSMFGTAKDAGRTLLMVVLLVILGFMVVRVEHWYYLFKRGFNQVLSGEVERLDTPWATRFPTKGPENAPIQVVMFGDYECPFCGMMKYTWNKVMEEYPDLVRFTSVAHPMNSDCNPMSANNTNHPFACKAAQLAKFVLQKKGPEAFWRISDNLYWAGQGFSEEVLVGFGMQEGLVEDDFHEIWRRSKTQEGLELDFRIAKALGLAGLPGTLLNGIYIQGYVEEWALYKMIDAELERKGLSRKSFRKNG